MSSLMRSQVFTAVVIKINLFMTLRRVAWKTVTDISVERRESETSISIYQSTKTYNARRPKHLKISVSLPAILMTEYLCSVPFIIISLLYQCFRTVRRFLNNYCLHSDKRCDKNTCFRSPCACSNEKGASTNRL